MPDPVESRLSLMLRALRHRNYRLFFAGQLVSLIGTFLTQIATVWLVYKLTHQAYWLGIAGFAGQIPMFLIAPFAGVWVDRLNRHRLIVATQILAMLQSFALAALALSGRINVPQIIALSAFQGLINAFDLPSRQAFLVEMVTDRNDLANAIALNSTMVHGARLIGPAFAGFLIHFVGEGYCFLLDGISYIAVIAALLAMQIEPRPNLRPARSAWAELADGLRYVGASRPIRALLALMGVFSLTGMAALVILMPIWGDYFGHGRNGAVTLGFLSTASGAGALTGALYLASRRSIVGLGRVISYGAIGFALAIMAFALSRYLWLSLAIAAVAGFCMLINFASANTLMQTFVDDAVRGRVMSLFTVSFIGMTPWGNLLAGALAHVLGQIGGHGQANLAAASVTGASRALLVEGAICLVAAISFARKLPSLRPIVRQLYIERGILPQAVTDTAIASTTALEEPAAR